MPDPTFISRGARVHVVGSSRHRTHKGEAGGLALDAVFGIRSRLPEAYPRFRFWIVSGRDEGDVMSGSIAFDIPVAATNGIAFVAERTRPSTSDQPRETAPPLGPDTGRFTLSLLSSGPKLQRGVYVVALREDTNELLTDWSRFTLENNQGRYSVSGDAFSYVILNVDYAK
jgi:hypothetical protein